MRVRPLLHVRGARRAEGRQRLRQPPLVRRRSRVQPGPRAVGSMAVGRSHDAAHAPRGPAGGALMAGVKRSIAVDLAGLALATPVMVAAGCAGTGRELAGLIDTRRVGAIVTRSITLRPRRGDPTPRIAESPAGITWSTGHAEPRHRGVHRGGAAPLRPLRRSRHRVHRRRHARGVRPAHEPCSRAGPRSPRIEVRLSEPDEELGRPVLGAHADRAAEIVGSGGAHVDDPGLREAPGGQRPMSSSSPAPSSAPGAHGLTLVDSPPAMGVDATTLRPTLGPGAGWLSGPALKPLTIARGVRGARALCPTHRSSPSEVCDPAMDAVEMLLAGAWAVQVGTATLIDPSAPDRGRAWHLELPEGEAVGAPRGPARSAPRTRPGSTWIRQPT